MSTEPSTPALDPLWKEMSLPYYLKELRLHLQEGWLKDPAKPKSEIAKYETQLKSQTIPGAPLIVARLQGNVRD